MKRGANASSGSSTKKVKRTPQVPSIQEVVTSKFEFYLQNVSQIKASLHPRKCRTRTPPIFGHPLEETFRHIGQVLAEAYLNPMYINWDAERYGEKLTANQTGRNENVEARLQKWFPPAKLGPTGKPAIVVDMHGRIICWYLPKILPSKIQEEMLEASHHLKSFYQVHEAKAQTDTENSEDDGVETDDTTAAQGGTSSEEDNTVEHRGWRKSGESFRPKDACPVLGRGNVDLSPGWLAQGHEQPHFPLHISPAFTHRNAARTSLKWLTKISLAAELTNAILSIVNPDQYRAGMEAMQMLRTHPEFAGHHKIAGKWTSVANGVAVIANRRSNVHRDMKGRRNWYDLLCSIGKYVGRPLHLPDLGFHLEYDPGTMVALNAAILRHEVDFPYHGERICYVWFMRDLVHLKLGIKSSGWPEDNKYWSHLHIAYLAMRRDEASRARER